MHTQYLALKGLILQFLYTLSALYTFFLLSVDSLRLKFAKKKATTKQLSESQNPQN